MKPDEGYNSDSSVEIVKSTIEKDAAVFRANYFVEKLMHNSANGLIYTGFSKITGKPVCIKQISRATVPEYLQNDDKMQPREFHLHMRAADCAPESVVHIYDCFVLIMEYPSDFIDMFEFSRQFGRIDEEPTAIILAKICKAVQQLVSGGIFHRDLKDENILIHPATLDIKLIDFGCATEWQHKKCYTELSGTPEFMAPEALNNRRYHAEGATVWSIGVIVFILLHGYLPTFDSTFKIRDDLSLDAKSLLNGMLDKDPLSRITIDQIRQSTWITSNA